MPFGQMHTHGVTVDKMSVSLKGYQAKLWKIYVSLSNFYCVWICY